MTGKRENVLSWDDYFMGVAFLSGQRSKDPVTQVGACIVTEDRRIVGVGYNGFPRGCSDDELPWTKTLQKNDIFMDKQFYVSHAEANAILNRFSADITGCTIYVSLYPCSQCAKLIIQSGIKKVVYVSDKHREKADTRASKRMLEMVEMECVPYVPSNPTITIDFRSIES